MRFDAVINEVLAQCLTEGIGVPQNSISDALSCLLLSSIVSEGGAHGCVAYVPIIKAHRFLWSACVPVWRLSLSSSQTRRCCDSLGTWHMLCASPKCWFCTCQDERFLQQDCLACQKRLRRNQEVFWLPWWRNL